MAAGVADVAQAADLGYTFGPWEFKEDITEKTVAYGHFVTVWKKQTDGLWKFALDLGISHAAPTNPTVEWQLPANYRIKSWKGRKGDVQSARTSLLDRDRQFLDASAAGGPLKAYISYSAPEIRLFRENSYPFAGITASSQALAATISSSHLLTWEPLGGEVSQSEDLGYTHGTYSVGSKQHPEKIIERGSYVRIWKKQNGNWKIVLDVTNAWPRAKQG